MVCGSGFRIKGLIECPEAAGVETTTGRVGRDSHEWNVEVKVAGAYTPQGHTLQADFRRFHSSVFIRSVNARKHWEISSDGQIAGTTYLVYHSPSPGAYPRPGGAERIPSNRSLSGGKSFDPL